MKKHFSLPLVIALFVAGFLFSCSQKDAISEVESEATIAAFTQADIDAMTKWILDQRDNPGTELDESTFPELEFQAAPTNSDMEVVQFYHNGIMYANDDLINGIEADLDHIAGLIEEDDRLDDAAKIYLYSVIQIVEEVTTTPELIEFYAFKGANARTNDPCGCDNIYSAWVTYNLQCQAYGNYWGHCTLAANTWSNYIACTNLTVTCPSGFTFDGANCYSGVHFPSGYNGFIYGNGFYTQQNCSISTANNCCPPGYGYDGANCHYWGLYFPSDYEPFIYNRTFYVKHKCL